MVDAPLLPDAADVVNMPSILTCDTSTGLTEAATFYQEQIPHLGRTLIGEPSITETTAMMAFTQDDQKMTVIITTGDAGKKVHIELGKAQE